MFYWRLFAAGTLRETSNLAQLTLLNTSEFCQTLKKNSLDQTSKLWTGGNQSYQFT